ncbi:polycystic kidney disease 2-like 2 protein [Tachyglossus aculeatus]|uniref:polycystic kidney disease 2-like 2 protein n=1 Tax=Tachyglossus aculeatus TaxID=9261 RepID=UPI0018F533D3|nr:polycystic kidney disease 2-like 2 protein [Tachyglossus aculeatus]
MDRARSPGRRAPAAGTPSSGRGAAPPQEARGPQPPAPRGPKPATAVASVTSRSAESPGGAGKQGPAQAGGREAGKAESPKEPSPAKPQRPQPAAQRGAGSVKTSLKYSKELEIRTTLQELSIYLIFLTDLCILTFGMVNTDMYYLNQVMANLFLETPVSESDRTNFRTIASMVDFWKYAEGPLLEGLFWDMWYNNQTLPGHKNNSQIYYENLLLGAPQVRQLKVRNNTCTVHPSFQSLMKECYYDYSFKGEDTSSFGLNNGPEWKYSASVSLSPFHWGSIGIYRNGGFVLTLPSSKSKSLKKLASLRLNSWLTRGTRVVFIDFSVYNVNINLFCIIRLVIEFPATGGALPSSQFFSVKLLRYITFFDYFLASCEVIFCLFILAFTVQEIIKIKHFKFAYFRSGWNWLEMLLVVISCFAIAFNIYRTAKVSLLLDKLLLNAQEYPDFYFLAYYQTQYNNVIAINVFFAWIKIFKFISFNKTMSQLSSTLSRCAKDIIGFAIMFFIIFFAYAQFGYLVFGSQVEEFSTFPNCIFTQFRIVLGDFNFVSIEQANRVLGPIYFITFVFFVFFVLLNMFLAIINDTYSEVKADFSVIKSPDFEISDLIRQGYNKALVKLKLKKTKIDDLYGPELQDKDLKEMEDLASLSGKGVMDEKSIQSAIRMKKWRDRLQQKYYSLEEPAAFLDHAEPVSQQEFQQLFLYMTELEKQLHYLSSKLNHVMKKISATNEAATKT